MNDELRRLDGTVQELRSQFDRSFAETPGSGRLRLDDVLEISVGAVRYALRTSDIAGLFTDRAITPLPTALPELRGLTAVRSSVVPVYDLAALLGHLSDPKPRWIALAAYRAVGLAFTGFERHIRVRAESVAPMSRREADLPHVREVLHVDDRNLPIVSIPSVLEAIGARVRVSGFNKER